MNYNELRAFETLDQMAEVISLLNKTGFKWAEHGIEFHNAIRALTSDDYNRLMGLLPKTNAELDWLSELRNSEPFFSAEECSHILDIWDWGAYEDVETEDAQAVRQGYIHPNILGKLKAACIEWEGARDSVNQRLIDEQQERLRNAFMIINRRL